MNGSNLDAVVIFCYRKSHAISPALCSNAAQLPQRPHPDNNVVRVHVPTTCLFYYSLLNDHLCRADAYLNPGSPSLEDLPYTRTMQYQTVGARRGSMLAKDSNWRRREGIYGVLARELDR